MVTALSPAAGRRKAAVSGRQNICRCRNWLTLAARTPCQNTHLTQRLISARSVEAMRGLSPHPLSSPPLQHWLSGRPAAAPGKSHVRLKTYIVEDNATIRKNLIETLEELTSVQAVGMAETETEGKLWLSQHPDAWDLAIVDLFLKQGSGLTLLTAMRQRQPLQKVVVLSNYATQETRERCAALGADAVFDKSNEIDLLISYCLGLTPTWRA